MTEEITYDPNAGEREPSSFRLIGTLGLAGFLSGIALVGIYLFTRPIIEKNKADALKEAIFKVLPQTTSFKTLALHQGTLTEMESSSTEVIFMGLNKEGKRTGFAISDREAGFQDFIGVLYGYDANKKQIIGYEVLECKETPGLGDKIFKNADFVANFLQLAVEPEILLVKQGQKKNANEVDAITGATISSRTVVKLLNRSMAKWKPHIENYLKNELQPNPEG